MRNSFARTLIAVLTLLVMLVQGTWVLAGTTGGLSGTVTDAQSGRPIAGARVSVASPSQSATATSDQAGRYGFISLGPDTYSLTITAPGYQAFSQPGITIIADQTTNFNFAPTKQIAEIGRTRSRSTTDLVKPGQTADVYSISGQLSQNAQGLGGGGSLFQTFAALASVPGVYVPQGTNFGQNNAAPYIRGGNYNQVGFEFDGIPVNRAFDNYVSNTQGVTGQQELQVYTGGVPSSSAGEGLSGYINQVIKTGTYPATANTEGVLGTPAFYHYLRGEYGGASPSRNFSYYVGSTGWSQAYRYGDQFSGGSGIGDLGVNAFGNFGGATGATPNGVTLAPFAAGGVNDLNTRETVANLHIGLPHRNGDGKDDIQILGSVGRQIFRTIDSVNEYGGVGSALLADYNVGQNGSDPAIAGGPYPYKSSTIYNGPIFGGFDPTKITPYYYPSAPISGCNAAFGPTSATPDGCVSGYIPNGLRGSEDNNNGIFKAQYQKNIGSSAYVRLYGYTNYSSWFIYDPIAAYIPYTAVGSQDYELITHTRGGALEFADQLNAHNLLTGSASYTFASVSRANNSTATSAGYRVQLRDGNGNCYLVATGALSNCYRTTGNSQSLTGGYTPATYTGTLAPITGAALANGASYQVAATGRGVTFNQVAPKFGSLSLSDQISVGDKLKLDIGARYNSYIYALADTTNQALSGGSNALLFQDYNQEHCFNATPAAGAPQFVTAKASTGFACPAGYTHPNLTNSYDGNLTAKVFEPRFGGTYTFSPYDVVRFSAGKYSQPTNSAAVQYNRAGDLASYTASNFLQYGFTSPRHDQAPQLSYNYDFSYEKRLKNSPLSFSFTPFYRQTKQQSQSFFLDPRTNFVSNLNVGTLRAFGAELLTRYGDFNRDGISGQVALAFTNSKIKYTNFPGQGNNLVDLINNELSGYNKLTAGGGGSPCYAGGAGVALIGSACPGGATPNPYYNQPLQSGLDRNGYFSPYDVVPAAAGGLFAVGSSNSYEVPFTMTTIVQYRKNGFRFVPTFQYDSGFRYGSPFAWQGYDPSACTTPNDTATCVANGQTIFRPNPYTGQFDGLGTFKSPGTLTISAQIAKDFSRRVTATAILSNIYHHCFTRGYAWEQGGNQACTYGVNAPYGNGGAYLGNGTTTGTNYARIQGNQFGYAPGGYGLPFNAFVSLSVKM